MISRRGLFRAIAGAVVTAAVFPLVKVGLVSHLTLEEIYSRTLRGRSGEIADNIMQNNALFQHLRARDG